MSAVRQPLFNPEVLAQDSKDLEVYKAQVNADKSLSSANKLFFTNLLNSKINFDLKINGEFTPILTLNEVLGISSESSIAFIKKYKEVKIFLDNNKNLMTKDIFPKYEALVIELKSRLEIFLKHNTEVERLYPSTVPHVQPLKQMFEQNKKDKLALDSKETDLQIKSFNFSKDGGKASLFELMKIYNANHRASFTLMGFNNAGEMPIYDSITDVNVVRATNETVNAAKLIIATFAQHKTQRDQAIAALVQKAKQQQGFHKPAATTGTPIAVAASSSATPNGKKI